MLEEEAVIVVLFARLQRFSHSLLLLSYEQRILSQELPCDFRLLAVLSRDDGQLAAAAAA